MFKFKRDIGAAGAVVVTIIILAGVAVSIFTYKGAIAVSDTGVEGAYEAYEILTGKEIEKPYHSPEGTYPGESGSGEVPVIPSAPDADLEHLNIIPEGATYITASGVTYNAGNEFPTEVTIGDIYIYGDYEYRFGQGAAESHFPSTFGKITWEDSSLSGWGVRCVNNISQPGTILENIAKQPVVCLDLTFLGYDKLEKAPRIPSSTQTLLQTFYGCSNLSDISNIVFPSGLIDVCHTFGYCTSLIDASNLVIPSSVDYVDFIFDGCASLERAPIIPEHVIMLNYAFAHCTNLTGEIVINSTYIGACANCFLDTAKPIIITGSTPYKAELAATANNGNVTY